MLVVGLGAPRDEWPAEVIRRASGVAARSLSGVGTVITTLSELHLEAAVEGLILGAYQMHEFRSARTVPKEPMLSKITALSSTRGAKASAERAVAVALRNRWRRQRLSPELRDEVSPKNILMIGPTGCGYRTRSGQHPSQSSPPGRIRPARKGFGCNGRHRGPGA